MPHILAATLAVALFVSCASAPAAEVSYRACAHNPGSNLHDPGTVVAHGFELDEYGRSIEWWDLVADGSPFTDARRIYERPARICGALGNEGATAMGRFQ